MGEKERTMFLVGVRTAPLPPRYARRIHILRSLLPAEGEFPLEPWISRHHHQGSPTGSPVRQMSQARSVELPFPAGWRVVLAPPVSRSCWRIGRCVVV